MITDLITARKYNFNKGFLAESKSVEVFMSMFFFFINIIVVVVNLMMSYDNKWRNSNKSYVILLSKG